MAKRVSGALSITADGVTLDISGAISIPLSLTMKESDVTNNGSVYYKETYIAPYIEGNFKVSGDFPFKQLAESDDMTIVARLANGLVYTLSGAFVDGEMVLETDGSTVDIKFSGTDGRFGK